MIELTFTLRVIQSSVMVYKWTMAMQFSFECIDPKDHKSEEEIKAVAVAVEGAMRLKLLLDVMQDGGVPPEH